MPRRVAVTGVGLLCSVGAGTEECWTAILAGKGGIGPITQFDPTKFSCRIAGEVKNFDPLAYVEKKDVKKMGRFIQFAIAASGFRDEWRWSEDRRSRCRDDRRVYRQRNRRVRSDRARTPDPARTRTEPDLPVLYSRRASSIWRAATYRSATEPKVRTPRRPRPAPRARIQWAIHSG